nr:HNH endonuclease [Pseudomonas sp. P818]
MNIKPVVGFEGRYEVSECGKIFSLIGARKEMRQSRHKSGYRYVAMWAYGANKPTYQRVHRVVAAAFIPNPEHKSDVNHKDGDKANNHADNLEWMTHSENAIHGFATGLMPKGERHPNIKVSRESAIGIYLSSGTYKQIAARYGVSPQTVSNIKHRRLHRDWLKEVPA